MREYRVQKAQLGGAITIPPSKSHTLRAILFGALGDGTTVIHHYLDSPDTHAMIEACRKFGAQIEVFPQKLLIEGLKGSLEGTEIIGAEDIIDAGNSGIVLRFCTALGALASKPVTITGDTSIQTQRNMGPLLQGLQQLGVKTASQRGDSYAPITVQGPLTAGHASIVGQDSQFVSALLIAAAFAKGETTIEVHDAGEKPWVALTLDWFRRLGIPCQMDNFAHYRLPGSTRYSGFDYTVPGDFSSAAFPIAAALVTQSELTLYNLDSCDSQGDKEIIRVFQAMGANIITDLANRSLIVKSVPRLQGVTVDINNFVDAITILAVVACFAEGETILQNAAIARHKECNRLQSITVELRKMGATIEETGDGLRIQKSLLRGTTVHSHDDHRMAMSLIVAALGAQGEATIEGVECIKKTFPTFASDLNALGAAIQEHRSS